MAVQPVYSTFTLDEDGDSQLFEYQSAVGSFQLFLLFRFATDPEHAAAEAFDEVVANVEKRLRSCDKGKSFSCFEQALKDINAVFDNSVEVEDRVSSGQLEMDAIVAILDHGTLHVAKTGHAESYLIRRGTLVEITDGMDNSEEEGLFVHIASGDLTANDKVLFTTRRLLRFVKKSDLAAMFSPHDIAACLEELQNVLAGEESGSLSVSACMMEGQDDGGDEGEVKPRRRSRSQKTLLPSERAIAVAEGFTVAATKAQETALRGWKWFSAQDRTRKVHLFGGFVALLVILWIVSVVFSSVQQNGQVEQMQQLFQQARSYVSDARNKKLFDAPGARASLDEAKKKLLEVARSGLFYNDVQQLLSEIEQEEEGADKIVRVSNPQVVVDLSKKDPAVSVIDSVYFNAAFYAVTNNAVLGPIVDSNPDSYSTNVADTNEIFLSAEEFPDRNVIALLTRANKLVEFKDNSFSFLETEDGTWKTGKEIRTYANRQFVYILDPASNAIWKYERTTKRYRGATNYNSDRADLKDAVSFAIDGNLYVLKGNGEVKRFYNQKLQPFTIEGGPSVPLSNLDPNSKIYTNEILRNIYILDVANERVLVYRKMTFEKTERMVYERQFIFKGETLRDVYVDDNEQGLYVTTAQKILKVDLRVP